MINLTSILLLSSLWLHPHSQITVKKQKVHRKPPLSSRLGRKPISGQIKYMEATAYEAGPQSCGIWAKFGRTKTGIRPHRGVVAVDPRVIPLKSKLYVQGYGYASAEDIGGAIKGNRIDLFMPTVRECLRWGRRKVKVWVIKTGGTK